jgi:hypothetical protein
MKRDVLGGGQPCGLAAASARGRRPPKAGGGPTKYHRLAFRNSLHGIGIIGRVIPFLKTQILNHEGKAFKA